MWQSDGHENWWLNHIPALWVCVVLFTTVKYNMVICPEYQPCQMCLSIVKAEILQWLHFCADLTYRRIRHLVKLCTMLNSFRYWMILFGMMRKTCGRPSDPSGCAVQWFSPPVRGTQAWCSKIKNSNHYRELGCWGCSVIWEAMPALEEHDKALLSNCASVFRLDKASIVSRQRNLLCPGITSWYILAASTA